MIDCAPSVTEIIVPAPEPSLADAAVSLLLSPLQPLREQFSAVTAIGLGSDDPEEIDGSVVRRIIGQAGNAGQDLGYLVAGKDTGRRVIFLHGSPGNAEEWGRFLLDLPEGRQHFAVDRPGFGQSGEEAVPDLRMQAKGIAPLLSPPDGARVVIAGYSYGGPLALQVAVDFPDRVEGLVLVASAADPELGSGPINLLEAAVAA